MSLAATTSACPDGPLDVQEREMRIIRTEKQKDNLAKFFWDMAKVILTLVFVTPLAQTGGLNFRQGAVGLSATFLLGLAGWLIDGQEVQ
jgi:hypothetical protein